MTCARLSQPSDLAVVAARYGASAQRLARRVIVCAGTGCLASGALKVREALVRGIQAAGLPVVVELKGETPANAVYVSQSGCQGFCQMGPLVTVLPDEILYVRVAPGDVPEIIQETLQRGVVVERLLFTDPVSRRACRGPREIPFYAKQHRVILKECGRMDPEDLTEYIHQGGYQAALRAYTQMKPAQICEEVLRSGLRGRGGAGFATGRKWRLALDQPGDLKYILCNGDEGDPGAFMNRSVMEGNPHCVLEGMMIGARAIGAREGILYVRAEYPLAVRRLRRAVADAESAGLLGDDLFGSGASLRVQVVEGAGAFVCGEGSAMIASIEGRRGMPRPKPPRMVESGLWGKPTVVNNVETFANVPRIIREGAEVFRRLGTPGSPGTKTFALTGHVINTGLIEAPFGITLREIVFGIGGGITDARGLPMADGFKAVQIGGPSGGCLTAEHLDLPLDFDSLAGVDAMVGSGGMVVMNRRTCMVDMARFFIEFCCKESCGKCVPCREGVRQMLALLDDIVNGKGDAKTLTLLETLCRAVQASALCGLGESAPNPVLSTLRYFRDEYEAHVFEKRCPSGQCKALTQPEIVAAKCRGCTACARKCPVAAIAGEARKPHRIDPAKCVRCGLCAQICKFDAVMGV